MTLESPRSRTAKYMQKHIEDFLPFLTDLETCNAYCQEKYVIYCDEIVCTSLCRGQLEL